jgi:nitrite reductase (NADH) large subunit
MKHVIIGNGIAGVSGAEAIRMLDPAAEITMIGDETVPPYSRPMISHVLDGSQPHNKLRIRSDHFYDDLNITPRLGQRARGSTSPTVKLTWLTAPASISTGC